jgi:hypothetical protein
MSHPPSIIRENTERIDNIITTDGSALELTNSAGITLYNNMFAVGGGVFCQIQTGQATGDILGEQELTNVTNARGTLYRVANTAQIGGCSRLDAHGNFTCASGKTLKITWKLGNNILGTTEEMNMTKNYNNMGWHLQLIWVVRALGDAGTASLSTTGYMTWLNKQLGESEEYDLNAINNTTYDTTSTQTFNLVAEWSSGTTASDIITLENCVITKLF